MEDAWSFLPLGYLLTVAIETPILLCGLGREHVRRRRIAAGLWLTACTYPLVILVFPGWFDPTSERSAYLLLAETFAPCAECALFWFAFSPLGQPWRDGLVLVAANLASFGIGEALHAGWLW